ncbi:MAG TPA: ATPase domain-containing protein [Dehalococcoidia bacterium]|nr:ATPase domain-containing protein [Dehalococcoidia bacterium]
MTTKLSGERQSRVISTGSPEIDRSIGGGIPYRSLMLIEGPSASGKSTLAQQFIWGALTAGDNAGAYITEQTTQSFLRQMSSLGQDVKDYFLLHHLEIFPISGSSKPLDPGKWFADLADHIAASEHLRIVVIDSLSTFVAEAGSELVQFFSRCKGVCDSGKVIICTVHPDAFDAGIMTRLRALCDAHLRLKVESSGAQLIKTIEVAKIRGAELATGNISGFAIEPGVGIRMLPISRARA